MSIAFKIIVALLLCCIASISYTQDKYSQQELSKIDSMLQLADIRASTDIFHLRIYLTGDVIDIATSDNKYYKGKRIQYYYSCSDESRRRHKNYRLVKSDSTLHQLETAQILKIYEILNSVPSDDSIWLWYHDSSGRRYSIVDGTEYSIATMREGVYSLKTYTSPCSRNPKCIEAKTVCNYLDSIRKMPSSIVQHNALCKTLKPGNCYTQDGFLLLSIPTKISPIRYRILEWKYSRYKHPHK